MDPLCFHNYKMGTYSIIFKYDNSKIDKDGEKLSQKHIYANPYDYIYLSKFWPNRSDKWLTIIVNHYRQLKYIIRLWHT